MPELLRNYYLSIIDPDQVDPAVHLATNDVGMVKYFNAEYVRVELDLLVYL
jgi:hypothetical protein